MSYLMVPYSNVRTDLIVKKSKIKQHAGAKLFEISEYCIAIFA